MKGILRVIPCSGQKIAQRIALLAEPPTLPMLERAVGGDPELVPNFETYLYLGNVVPCMVYCRKGAKKDNLPPNGFASLLLLQAQIRLDGFAHETTYGSLLGSIALVHGDREFMSTPLSF